MRFSNQFGLQLADKMALHEFDGKIGPNAALSIRSNSCSAVDNKQSCLSTIRSRSEVPIRRELHSSTQGERLRIALKQPRYQHIEDRKQKPLGGSQEVQGFSRSNSRKPDCLRVPREESPPPEIISVRKVQHTRPTKPTYAISESEHTTTSSSLQHPPPAHQHNQIPTNLQPPSPTYNMGSKRQQPQAAGSEKKRQKVTVSNNSPAGDSNVCGPNLFICLA